MVKLFFDYMLAGYRVKVKRRLKLAGYKVVTRVAKPVSGRIGSLQGVKHYDFQILRWLKKHRDFILITSDKALHRKATKQGLTSTLIPMNKGEVITEILKSISPHLRRGR